MNANELRLGNLVGFYQPELKELQTGHIAGITKDDIGVPEFSERVCLSPNGITGIPLTEEWLLKFGFNSDLELKISSDYCSMKFRHEVWWLYNNDCDSVIASLTYVHQLQNLYFALTGEELILKT